MNQSNSLTKSVLSWAALFTGLWILAWFWWAIQKPEISPDGQGLAEPAVALSVPHEPKALPQEPAPVPDLPAPTPRPAIATNAPNSEPVIPAPPPSLPPFSPRLPKDNFEIQLALARQGISPGSLDGVIGPQTRAALRAFQEREGIPATGAVNEATRSRLLLTEAPTILYTVTSNDLSRLKPVGGTWLAKSKQDRLDYETILELLGEKGQAHPKLILTLNPHVNWTNVIEGTQAVVPNVRAPPVRANAAFVRIRLGERILQAFDSQTNLLAQFPCSIARRVEKRPLGQLFVEEVAYLPTYRFDPQIFRESEEARRIGRPLTIAPGPNNPVGTAWIGLNWPGYGIHGSPKPEEVGRTESMGCFRLANWNAEFLAKMVRPGTPVFVEL